MEVIRNLPDKNARQNVFEVNLYSFLKKKKTKVFEIARFYLGPQCFARGNNGCRILYGVVHVVQLECAIFASRLTRSLLLTFFQ